MGYSEAMRILAHALNITAQERIVAQVIAARVNSGTGEASPSIAVIAADAGISPRTARRHIQSLIDAGVIAVSRRWNNSNVYSIALKCECEGKFHELAGNGIARVGMVSPPVSSDLSDLTPPVSSGSPGVSGLTGGGVRSDTLGCQTWPPNREESRVQLREESREDTLVSPELDEPVQDVVSTTVQEQKTYELPQQRTSEENYTWGFDSFIKAYPKPGSNFIRTKNAFTYYANNRADAEKIIRSAICYKRSLVWKNSDGKENNPFQFAKDPAEWLKAGEWRRDDWPTHPHGDWMSKGIHEGKLDRQVAEAIASEDLRVAGGTA